jgi:hypothetical protein
LCRLNNCRNVAQRDSSSEDIHILRGRASG